MAATAQRLARQGIPIEEFPQSTPNLTAASQNLFELINGRNLVAYPDPAMRLAISRAVAIESSRGWRITKEKQSHKIDVVVALAMAAYAAVKTGESRKISWCGRRRECVPRYKNRQAPIPARRLCQRRHDFDEASGTAATAGRSELHVGRNNENLEAALD